VCFWLPYISYRTSELADYHLAIVREVPVVPTSSQYYPHRQRSFESSPLTMPRYQVANTLTKHSFYFLLTVRQTQEEGTKWWLCVNFRRPQQFSDDGHLTIRRSRETQLFSRYSFSRSHKDFLGFLRRFESRTKKSEHDKIFVKMRPWMVENIRYYKQSLAVNHSTNKPIRTNTIFKTF